MAMRSLLDMRWRIRPAMTWNSLADEDMRGVREDLH